MAAGAVDEAGEDKIGMGAAGIAEGVFIGVVAFLTDELDGIPGGLVDEGGDIILDYLVAIMEITQVETVGKEIGVAVFGAVEMGGVMDLDEAGAGSAHFPGGLAGIPFIRVGNPAADGVGFAIAAGTDVDGFAFEANGGPAGQRAVLFEDVRNAAFDIAFKVLEVFGVHPIDGGLEESSVDAIGNVVI